MRADEMGTVICGRRHYNPCGGVHARRGIQVDRAPRKRVQGKVRTGDRANIDTCDKITRKKEDTHAKGLKPSLCI